VGVALWTGGASPFPGWPLALFTALIVAVGLREFYDGCRKAEFTPRDWVGYGAAGVFLLAAFPPFRAVEFPLLTGGLTALVMISLASEALRRDHAPLRSLPVTWLGAVYIAWLAPFLLRLRVEGEGALASVPWSPGAAWMAASGKGGWIVLLLFLATAAADSGAYFVGKSLGKHKMAPEVSPGKTWEGFAGGCVAAVLVGLSAGVAMGLSPAFSAAVGAVTAAVAPLGDLSKSAIKREIGIKDFGALLPGHGGALDRFDSLLFVAPAVYWLAACWPS
jgi:phosphatidate cytidylyltransferase